MTSKVQVVLSQDEASALDECELIIETRLRPYMHNNPNTVVSAVIQQIASESA